MPFGDGHTYRGNKPGTLTIGDQFIDFLGRRPLGLAFPNLCASGRQTGATL
jgi:hypothetical protein